MHVQQVLTVLDRHGGFWFGQEIRKQSHTSYKAVKFSGCFIRKVIDRFKVLTKYRFDPYL